MACEATPGSATGATGAFICDTSQQQPAETLGAFWLGAAGGSLAVGAAARRPRHQIAAAHEHRRPRREGDAPEQRQDRQRDPEPT